MLAHQQRVASEKADLDARLTALRKFISDSPVFKLLDSAEKIRLRAQACVMGEYSDILGERIAAFPKE